MKYRKTVRAETTYSFAPTPLRFVQLVISRYPGVRGEVSLRVFPGPEEETTIVRLRGVGPMTVPKVSLYELDISRDWAARILWNNRKDFRNNTGKEA